MAARNGNGESGTKSVFRLDRRPGGIAVAWMDDPDEPVNTLKPGFEHDFARLLDEIEGATELRGVVFTSGKPDSFVAGANLEMLQSVRTAEQAAELSRTGQRVLGRLAAVRVPVVAAIHGPCLGGGLEIALACKERIASDDRKTKLGVPEVQLGLLPAARGTQVLPRLLGVQVALDLLLTGKQLDGRRAKKIGLVDDVVPQAILLDAAIKRATELANGTARAPKESLLKKLVDPKELTELALEDNPLGRKILFDQAKNKLLEKTHGNYPAPERILEVVRIGLDKGMQAGLEAEAQRFGELVVSPESRALVSIFFATTALKKDRGTEEASATPRRVDKVAMLGAGLMGAGIGYVTAALARIPVRLKDKDDAGVGRGLAYIRGILDERVDKRRMTALERDQVLARVTATTDYSGVANADVVIEAVFEDVALKHRVLADVEATGRPETIFASNTSSIPITKIAEASKRPETVIGMHYFSPVHKMPLLEIIVQPKTAPWVTATCVELGKKQGKTVIVVNDGVGFYTSRILGPYMNEAAYLLAEGVPIEAIDEALVKWGYPIGPITLLDEVGIDVAHKVGKIVHDAFGDRLSPPPGVDKLYADERYGKKNKRGFYLYEGDRKKGKREVDKSVYRVLGIEPTASVPASEIAERCALQMINEAALCFGEGILRSARDGDIGAIFGLGFPPFRGGPFRYIDAVGAAEIVRRLEHYTRKHGKRFTPAPVLVGMAKTGGRFHGDRAPRPGQTVAEASASP